MRRVCTIFYENGETSKTVPNKPLMWLLVKRNSLPANADLSRDPQLIGSVSTLSMVRTVVLPVVHCQHDLILL